jgi:hypothetical protein
MGTRGLISNDRANNEQKQDPTDQTATQNPHNKGTDNENIINNDEPDNEIHNHVSGDIIETRVSFEQKLVPKTPQTYSDYLIDGVPIWQIENRGMTKEEGEAYKQEVERLKEQRKSKVADTAEANSSRDGIMGNKEKDTTM